MNILSKIRNMIAWCRKTNIGRDNQQFPQGQYEYQNKVKEIVYLYPYGMHANAPLDTLGVKMNIAHEENPVVLESSMTTRPKGLKSGEAIFGNFVVGATVKFLQNGDIEVNTEGHVIVKAETATITADVTVNGNTQFNGDVTIGSELTVNGDITATGSISAGGLDFGSHVHSVTTAPGTTGGPM